jgi:hypothetical protein
MRRLAFLIASLALAAPGFTLPQQPTAKTYSDRLAKLTDLQRKGTIRAAIVESDLKCGSVEAVAHQGSYKNLEMWVARCGPKPTREYGVFLGPDGSAQVSPCADLVKVKWPACRPLP